MEGKEGVVFHSDHSAVIKLSSISQFSYGEASTLQLSIPKTVYLALNYLRIEAMDEICDFEFTQEEWNRMKVEIGKEMTPPDEWVSSYEAIMALLLECLPQKKTRTQEGYALVNLRGRSEAIPLNYMGVGIVFAPFSLPAQANVAERALALHKELRARLSNVASLEKEFSFPDVLKREKTGRFNHFTRLRLLTRWRDAFFGHHVVLNSWVGQPWLEVTFGTGERASFLRVHPKFGARRMLLLFPRDATTLVLRVQLPSKEMSHFRSKLLALPMQFCENS
jgi:hypothetical protein